jgi:hypothetical protein
VDVRLPADAEEKYRSVVEEHGPEDAWQEAGTGVEPEDGSPALLRFKMVVDAGRAEPLLDELEQEILKLLPARHFDLIISHNPSGEYTRHRRHEEVSKAVIHLWHSGKLSADEIGTFVFEDGHRRYLHITVENAPIYKKFNGRILSKKYALITNTYGFTEGSWAAQTTPQAGACWRFNNSTSAQQRLHQAGVLA